MCLIIDANMICAVLGTKPNADTAPLREALFEKKARAVYGGKLAEEYLEITYLRRLLTELDRNGSLYKVATDDAVKKATTEICDEGLCVSNDHHIIALARLSGVRLLCSHDKNLHVDFTNPSVLRPRGSVYQNQSHSHLIRQHCHCATKRRQASGPAAP
jgi:hypothetical protein